jgi:hypothetical protein
MLEASPYIILIMAVLLIVFIGGFLWICRAAMRSGMAFEGEIKNRLLSMKIRTNLPPGPGGSDGSSGAPAEPDPAEPEEGAR